MGGGQAGKGTERGIPSTIQKRILVLQISYGNPGGEEGIFGIWHPGSQLHSFSRENTDRRSSAFALFSRLVIIIPSNTVNWNRGHNAYMYWSFVGLGTGRVSEGTHRDTTEDPRSPPDIGETDKGKNPL